MKDRLLGYAIVRGTNSLLIYDKGSDSWKKKPDKQFFFDSLSSADEMLQKIKKFKGNAGIMSVTESNERYFIFSHIR
ncbi:TPA: hypothetical protein ACKREV_000443 [Providencia stuartii]|uniref:hypothetical protein n=1 Tax=Providencia stuartii TaxID=588 RepID=UPI0033221883